MFNTTHVHEDHSIRFPDTIKIHEHRAPTDESVRLLNEMEEKSLADVVCKISETRNNKFSYNIFFVRFASLDFMPKAKMVIKFTCNGKSYTRSVTCTETITMHVANLPKSAKMIDLPMQLQHYVLFEIAYLIAQVLLEVNDETLKELFDHAAFGDPVKFDLNTLKEEILYQD